MVSSNYSFILFCVFFTLFVCTLSVLRPRGVPLNRRIFYDPNKRFRCMDGSGVIPFKFINDDYCDCEDGSDEPGTAACTDGEFVCSNYGHLPMTLPSSRVNDGICDCCDASDEFNSTADCLDTCKELGMQSLNAAKSVFDQYSAGNNTRHVYIFEAIEKKEEYRKQLAKLREKESELLQMKIYKQELKDKAEEEEHIYLDIQKQAKKAKEQRLERQKFDDKRKLDKEDAKKAFEYLDLNQDGKLSLEEVQSFPQKFDYDKDGVVSEMEAKFYTFKFEELTLKQFHTYAWSVIKATFIEEPGPEDEEFFMTNPDYHVAKVLGTAKPKDPEPIPQFDEAKIEEIFSEAAIRRKEFADANKSLQDVQDEIWNIEKKLSMDYGPEDAFLALENKCFEYTEKRYVYKLCLFDKAIQMARHNSDEILLGLWDKWCGPSAPLDKYSHMCYTRGSSCWNGPMRSVIVSLQCGLENKLASVVETSPCVYMFNFETPASCKTVPAHVFQVMNNHVVSI